MRDEAATRFLAEPFPAPIAEIERQRAARRSLATSLTQRIAAESASMVEYAAMLVASRQPALQSKLTEVLSSTRRSRVSASSATEQAALDMKAVLEILRLGVAPKATERSAT
jgi:anti-sigma factor RsiW